MGLCATRWHRAPAYSFLILIIIAITLHYSSLNMIFIDVNMSLSAILIGWVCGVEWCCLLMVNLSTTAQGLIKPQSSLNLTWWFILLNTDTIKIFLIDNCLFHIMLLLSYGLWFVRRRWLIFSNCSSENSGYGCYSNSYITSLFICLYCLDDLDFTEHTTTQSLFQL